MDGKLVKERVLLKIEIPAELFDELDDYLRISGLRAFSFFPDFYGLKLEHEARVSKTLQDIELFLKAQQKAGHSGS